MEHSDRFYLGRLLPSEEGAAQGEPLFYRPADLTTHAVCMGMTGSGKTGLGVVLLEEAALQGIPALVIDPKGDLTNLLLAFPKLRPEDFRPWVSAEVALRRGMSVDELAAETAEEWRAALREWGIDGERIRRLRDAVEWTIYTPGSETGQPVNIVRTLQCPDLDWGRDEDLLREQISGTVSALLELMGMRGVKLTDREHILLSQIIEVTWRAGEDLDLISIVSLVQDPPFDQLGVLPLESFYPRKDRDALAMALNALLAAPWFENWLVGDPLDVGRLLYTSDGRPRVSIFSIAHLDEPMRFFFVTLLLEQVRMWLRDQPGTPELRALLYFDELYGYLPPHPANPPTKAPLLALLKQARAQGLGLVLATQNPADLDYKVLSNAGTWFVGTLQTARDRERVLEGVLGSGQLAGVLVDRDRLMRLMGMLEPRVFLMHNVHTQGPVLFRTRHTMAYLRGPMTREQIQRLSPRRASPPPAEVAPRRRAFSEGRSDLASVKRGIGEVLRQEVISPSRDEAFEVEPLSVEEVVKEADVLAEEVGWEDEIALPEPPPLPAGVFQCVLPVTVPLEWAIHEAETELGEEILYTSRRLVYKPAFFAEAHVLISRQSPPVSWSGTVSRLLLLEGEGVPAWDRAMVVRRERFDASVRPAQGAFFLPLPAGLERASMLQQLRRGFVQYVRRTIGLSLWRHPTLKLVSEPDEPLARFRQRCRQAVEEKREAEIEKLEAKYQRQLDRLEERLRKEEMELEMDLAEYEARKREEWVTNGETVLGMLTGRRQTRGFSIAMRKHRLTQQAKADVEESEQVIADLEAKIEALEEELEAQRKEIEARWDAELAQRLERIEIRPAASNIQVERWGIAWVPVWEVTFESAQGERTLQWRAFEEREDE